ncbi:CbrC family protein [Streptomyces sp. DG1A-41]|uniref:CbrC family protein n=1 Tax=Streptomyces sp. DG1A-41 TaxID=3125779 RepID=UPI0030CE99B7
MDSGIRLNSPLENGPAKRALPTRAACSPRVRGAGSASATRAWIYTATIYTAHEVNGRFCPWCIADGSVAERFAGGFSDAYGPGSYRPAKLR